MSVVEIIDAQAAAHHRAAAAAEEHLAMLRAVREEDAALAAQVLANSKALATKPIVFAPDGRPAATVAGERDGGRSVDKDQLQPGLPASAPPRPAVVPSPSAPSNYAPQGASAAGTGNAASQPAGQDTSQGQGRTGGLGVTQLVSSTGSIASIDWIRKNGRKFKKKIFNPANPLALFRSPPDLVEVDAWDTPLGVFLDPDSLAGLGQAHSLLAETSNQVGLGDGPGYAPPVVHFGRQSSGSGGPNAPPVQFGGSSSAENHGPTFGVGGGPTSGSAETKSAPAPSTTPGDLLIARGIDRLSDIMRDISRRQSSPSTGIELRRQKL